MSQTVASAHRRAPSPIRWFEAWLGDRPLTQFLIFAALVIAGLYVWTNISSNMSRLGLAPGFAYLARPANFDISEQLIAYHPGDTYARALVVGLLNTVKVSIVGCLLATLLGLFLGIVRLSGNLLLARLVQAYVELVRNTPLPLQLFFWMATFRALPPAKKALEPLPSVFLSVRGVFLPRIAFEGGDLLAFVAALMLAAGLAAVLLRRRQQPLRLGGVFLFGVGALALALLAGHIFGLSFRLDRPHLQGFNIIGGLTLTTEFAALLIGLVVNSAAGISEIVRSGIESVSAGQWEAGRSLGLSRGRIMRLIVLPQAMRVITPLLTSSYLDLTKNSSLGVLIGYSEIVAVVNTSANNTGQAIETIVVLVSVFLTLNLTVSALMNRYNRRMALRGMIAA